MDAGLDHPLGVDLRMHQTSVYRPQRERNREPTTERHKAATVATTTAKAANSDGSRSLDCTCWRNCSGQGQGMVPATSPGGSGGLQPSSPWR